MAVSRRQYLLFLPSLFCIPPSAFWLSGDLLLFAPNTGSLPFQASKIKKLSPSHLSSADHIDSIDSGRMVLENPLDTNTIRDFPYCKGRSNPSPLLTNDHSFKGLYPLFLSLHDLHMDPYGISHPEIREICSQLFSFDQFHQVHLFLLFQIRVPGFEGSWVQVFTFSIFARTLDPLTPFS